MREYGTLDSCHQAVTLKGPVMGWKSTMEMTRARCLSEINARLLSAPDEVLESTLEPLVEAAGAEDPLRCYNFVIVEGSCCKVCGRGPGQ